MEDNYLYVKYNDSYIRVNSIDLNSNNNYDDIDEDIYNNYLIKNDLNDSNNYIKIYNTNGTLIKSYKSNNTYYNVSLSNGTYYIIDSRGALDKLYFKIEDNNLYVKYNNSYRKVSSITLNKNNDYSDDEIIDNNEDINYDNSCVCNNNKCNKVCNVYYDEDGNILDINDIEITNDVNVDVNIDWLSNVIDCPITDLSSTLKYILGAIILGSGTYLVYRNVKKSKNNI